VLNPESPLGDRLVDRLGKWRPLEALADAWQPFVQSTLKGLGSETADLLHGTPFGHPLHPLLTDIPIGAWTVTALLDAAELLGRDELQAGADAALLVGLAGAGAAAASGWAEWSDTDGAPKNIGMAHASLNATAVAAYLLSLALRRSGKRGGGIAVSMFAYALVAAAGYLGGELSFGLQLGVRHTGEPIDPPKKFVPALDLAKLSDGTMQRVEVANLALLFYRDGDSVFAISANCTHRGAPLDEGKLKDGCVECPWHGSTFRFSDAGIVRGPATFSQPRFETRVRNGTTEVRA